MDKEPKRTVASKEELIASLDQARGLLRGNLDALGHSLNPSSRLRHSMGRHRTGWIVGSLAGGFLGTRFLLRSRRRRKRREESGTDSRRFGILPVLAFLLKYSLTLSRPAVAKLLEKRAVRMVE